MYLASAFSILFAFTHNLQNYTSTKTDAYIIRDRRDEYRCYSLRDSNVKNLWARNHTDSNSPNGMQTNCRRICDGLQTLICNHTFLRSNLVIFYHPFTEISLLYHTSICFQGSRDVSSDNLSCLQAFCKANTLCHLNDVLIQLWVRHGQFTSTLSLSS